VIADAWARRQSIEPDGAGLSFDISPGVD